MSEVIEFVEVGGTQYRVIKTGRAQAEQVLGLTRWISKHGSKAMNVVSGENKPAGESGIAFLTRFIDALDADALIDLFAVLVGCPQEDAEVYFDVAILVDTVIEVYQRNQSLRRLVDRFFSSGNSEKDTESNSTTSE